MRIIALITDGPTVLDILVHLGEPTTPRHIAPARGPPLWELRVTGVGGFVSDSRPPRICVTSPASTRDSLP